MSIKPVKTDKNYREALKRVDQLWDAQPNTLEGDELDVLVTLITAYEDIHYEMSAPEPVEAIKFRMEQLGLNAVDLKPYIGARSRVSEVLNLKRSLSLPMIRKLSAGLNIPAQSLIQEYKLSIQ